MARLDFISAAVWLLFSVAVAIRSYYLGLGSFREPGVGFLFFLCSVVLGTLSLVVGVRAVLKMHSRPLLTNGSPFQGVAWLKVLSVLVSVLVYGVILEYLGFLIGTTMFLGFLLRSIEYKRWYIVLFVSVSSSVLAYILFEVVLNAHLPKGIFGV